MLSESDLTNMRTVLNDSLPGTATLTSGTIVSDSGGGGTTTFAASGTVDCRVAPVGGSDREVADRLSSEADWIITLPAQTSIQTDDRIVTNGGTFAVVAVHSPRSYEISTRVEARQLA